MRIIKASTEGKIPYQLVSMAAILRDYDDPTYISDTHEKLVDIADSIYNVGEEVVDRFTDDYKKLYDQFGAEYFDKILDDMNALDGQLTSDAKVQELVDDYNDRIGVSASSKVCGSSGNPFYDKLSAKDKRFAKNTVKQMAEDVEDVTPSNICEIAMKTLPAEDIDHHETDLYIRKTPQSTALINKMQYKDCGLLTTFIDNIDHEVWYELPFCYSPVWQERLSGRS